MHVVVSRALTELALAPSASLGLRGRWQATLAHEAAHILLHAKLYALGELSRAQTAIRDLADETDASVDVRDWKELQANMGMAALLMPRQPFLSEARRILENGDPVFPPFARASEIAKRLTDELAETFQASHQATGFRLVEFGFTEDPDDPRRDHRALTTPSPQAKQTRMWDAARVESRDASGRLQLMGSLP